MQHILFAHSAGAQSKAGQGSYDLVAYLKKELGNAFDISCPVIEDPEDPTYAMWKSTFDAAFKKITAPVVLIGHSLGASTLLKYLSEEKPGIPVVSLHLVATPHWGENMKDFMLKDNFEDALTGIPKIFLYQSVNDKIVPFEHLGFYREAFKQAVVHELPGNDHVFAKGLPELVNDIRGLFPKD